MEWVRQPAEITGISSRGRILHATHVDGLTVVGSTVWVIVDCVVTCIVVTLVVATVLEAELEAATARDEL